MKKKLIIVSGYFNPLHKGHIEYFHSAKKYADKLIVIINNDNQREKKGSKEFMKEEERLIIISELSVVDYTELSIDEDRTVVKTILKFIKIIAADIKYFLEMVEIGVMKLYLNIRFVKN